MALKVLVATRKGLFTLARNGARSAPWSIERTDFLADNVSLVVHDKRSGLAFTQQRSEDIGGADMNAIDLAQRSDMARANAVARIEAKHMHYLLFPLRKLGA